jgi:hypothetical protein
MSRVGVHKDHQVIGEPRVLHRGVPQASRNGLGTFQHPIYLGEIDVAEQRRDHPALRNALFARCLEDQPQQSHHVIVLNPERHLVEQQVMPHGVKVGPQIQIYDERLLLDDRLRDAVHRFMR